MLDINLIRQNSSLVQTALKKRGFEVQFEDFLAWDEERRRLTTEVESLRARRNEVSSLIPKLKKEGKGTAALLEEMKGAGEKIKDLDQQCDQLGKKVQDFLDRLPNLPDDDVVAGGKENNAVIRTFGAKPVFPFTPRDHVEIAKELRLIDYERGVKLGGNGFWLYCGDGALLEWALLSYFIDEHRRAGFQFILPPHILQYASGYTAGQFPKFIDDVFCLEGDAGKDGGASMRFLLPTAETALVNLYRDEILQERELPKKYFSYSPCYRKEAGGYGASERGMVRGHQFNKIELFAYARPEDSDQLLEDLIARGERLMQGLGLHYQVSKLAAADCGASMAKTYDIEVWIPSMNIYKEVSSASNARDFQARRGNMRYKSEGTGKNLFMHTLNASGLATSRLFPAILEQFQQSDGSVAVPKVLQQWVGKEFIRPL